MQFTVTFEEGVWSFEVNSTGDEDTYYEEYELTDLNEAREAVWALVEEISVVEDDMDDIFGTIFSDEAE